MTCPIVAEEPYDVGIVTMVDTPVLTESMH